MRNIFLQTLTGTCLTALLGTAAFARDVTGLTVADGTVSVTFEAGDEGDSHVLYYVWSTDGADKGTTLAAWPNIYRVDRVADDAASYSFTLPAEAFLTGQYACRAFLATSEKKYDYLVEGVQAAATKNCYVDTDFKPTGGKTAIAIDCQFTTATEQYYILGVNGGNFSFCAYINGNGYWAFSGDNGEGSWTATTLKATTERADVTLDVTGQASVFTVTTPSGSVQKELTESHTKVASYTLYLFGRNKSNANDKSCAATIYSCVITNDGACVRFQAKIQYTTI